MLIERLNELLIQKLIFSLIEEPFMEGLDNQTESSIRNTICTAFLFCLGEMVIEISLPDIGHQVAVIESHIVRNLKGADYIQRTHTIVGAQKLNICYSEHIISVEHSSMYDDAFNGFEIFNSVSIHKTLLLI